MSAAAGAANEAARAEAAAFAATLAEDWQARLGSRFLGAYLIGSLAHGGFSRRYSDIDMGLIAEDGLGDGEIAAMRAQAVTLAPGLAAKLSLFWGDRGFTIGRFPPLDRVDLVDHAVALAERERVRPPRPSRGEIRAYLAGQPFASWAEAAQRFAAQERLEDKDRKPFIRAVLYPARFVYSWVTGGMGSNDDAVALTLARKPAGLDLRLIQRALALRQGAADPDPLFAARATLPDQVMACARLMEEDR